MKSATLPPPQLLARWNDLVREGQILRFKPGQNICYEGHEPYGLMVIRSGGVRFTRGRVTCETDHPWQSPQGMVIGLHHFITKTAFCCTCTALEPCEVVFIPKSSLLEII